MAGDNDFKAHAKTYDGVMAMLKWGTILTAIVTAFVIFIIA